MQRRREEVSGMETEDEEEEGANRNTLRVETGGTEEEAVENMDTELGVKVEEK